MVTLKGERQSGCIRRATLRDEIAAARSAASALATGTDIIFETIDINGKHGNPPTSRSFR